MPQLKIDRNEFLGLGRQNPQRRNEPFGMTVLAHPAGERHQRRQQAARQRVAEDVEGHLAGAARRPRCRSRRSPTASTRGAGCRPRSSQLYDRYLGVQWEERPTDFAIWKRVEHIPDAELWRTHERGRERLVAFARSRLQGAAEAPRRRRRARSPRPTRCSTRTR